MSFYDESIVSCCGLPSVTRMVSRRMVFGPVATYDCDCNSLNWGLVSVDSKGRLRPVRQLLMLGLYMLMRVANVPATEDGLVYMGRTQASGSMADMISLAKTVLWSAASRVLLTEGIGSWRLRFIRVSRFDGHISSWTDMELHTATHGGSDKARLLCLLSR